MNDKEIMGEYLGRVQILTNQMIVCGESLKEQIIVEKVLRSLHSRFDHIVVAIEESKDLEILSLEQLQYSLEAHEARINERNAEKDVVEALWVHGGKLGRGNGSMKKNKGKLKNKDKRKWKRGSNSEIVTRIIVILETGKDLKKRMERSLGIRRMCSATTVRVGDTLQRSVKILRGLEFKMMRPNWFKKRIQNMIM